MINLLKFNLRGFKLHYGPNHNYIHTKEFIKAHIFKNKILLYLIS